MAAKRNWTVWLGWMVRVRGALLPLVRKGLEGGQGVKGLLPLTPLSALLLLIFNAARPLLGRCEKV